MFFSVLSWPDRLEMYLEVYWELFGIWYRISSGWSETLAAVLFGILFETYWNLIRNLVGNFVAELSLAPSENIFLGLVPVANCIQNPVWNLKECDEREPWAPRSFTMTGDPKLSAIQE